MRRILILGRNHHPDGKETATEIHQGLLPFMSSGYHLELGYWTDLIFDVHKDRISAQLSNGQDLKEFDCLLMTNWFSHASIRKDIAHAVALYCQYTGTPCLNSEALHSRSTSKLSQLIVAAINGIPVPRTLFGLSYDRLCQEIVSSEGLKLPAVIKDAQASRGKANYLIHSEDGLEQHKKEHTEQHPFMAQEFIVAPMGDYRFFVAGGRVKLVIKRLPTAGSHLTNTSAGALTELLKPGDFKPEIITMVERISVLLHREVTGVDIIFDAQDRPYFLEANPIPQIATGSNVRYKLEALAGALQDVADQKGGKS